MAKIWWTSERGILYALDLNSEPPRILPRALASFLEIKRDKVGLLATAMGGTDEWAIGNRLASGRRCFGAQVDGRLAAYGWVSQGAECIGEQEREIRLEPREAYIWECATTPEYRGKRLYSALLSYIVGVLRTEGAARVWIGTALANKPSLRGFVNAGFRPVLTLAFARLLSVHVVLEIGHPSAPTTLVAAARRALLASDEHTWGSLVVGWTRHTRPAPCAELQA